MITFSTSVSARSRTDHAVRSGAGTVCGQWCLFFFFPLFPERGRFKCTFRFFLPDLEVELSTRSEESLLRLSLHLPQYRDVFVPSSEAISTTSSAK